MFTLITTWVAQRILTVTAVSVVTVAAVPTTLVISSHHDDGGKASGIAVIQPANAQAKAVLISEVKKAGDGIIARLSTAQTTCDNQLAQTVSTSKVATTLQPALAHARATVGSSITPIVAAVRNDEEHFAHLTNITPQDEENELEDLNLIEILALGSGQTSGTVTITCQTVTITITQTVQITVMQQTPPPCTSKDERDDD